MASIAMLAATNSTTPGVKKPFIFSFRLSLFRKAARQKVPAARTYANAVPALSALNIAHRVTILTRVTIETSGAADGFTSASTYSAKANIITATSGIIKFGNRITCLSDKIYQSISFFSISCRNLSTELIIPVYTIRLKKSP